MPFFSIIVPVYNRPQEVEELLQGLSRQTNKEFELILVEDGSTDKCKFVAERYVEKMNISYYYKENSGRSSSRNYGMKKATGDYFVFFDSDCIIPPDYFQIVKDELQRNYADCYGGPDKTDASFSNMQKAIGFSMTSFLTTGGIRGGKKGLEKFTPRTFNMGFSKEVYQRVGGFKDMFGEDIDMSLRIRAEGFTTRLLHDAFVYHKRRVSFRAFWRQVFVFGMARIDLYLLHPHSLKAVHALPALFTVASAMLLAMSLWDIGALALLLFYFVLIFIVSSFQNKSIAIGGLSVIASAIQLYGYGCGFIKMFVRKIVLGRRDDKEKELDKYYRKK